MCDMMRQFMSEKKSLDILGIQPVAEAVNKLTTGAVDGAAAFLSRICLPAAEEFGLLLRDKVHHWRSANMVAVTQMAEAKLTLSGAGPEVYAHPRLLGTILDEGSWTSDSEVQEMWAGLLASSCTASGDDDSNLLFVNLLSRLTRLQARVMKYACEHLPKAVTQVGLIVPLERLTVSRAELVGITGEDDVQRLDRELDHLRSLELLAIHSGFPANSVDLTADITPTGLAIHMYVRCQGVRKPPPDYFGLKPSDASMSDGTAQAPSSDVPAWELQP